MKKLNSHMLATSWSIILLGFINIILITPWLSLKYSSHGDIFIKRHIYVMLLGLSIQIILFLAPFETLKQKLCQAFTVILGIMIITALPSLAKSSGGAHRWIGIQSLSFQPSALFKILWIHWNACTLHIFHKNYQFYWDRSLPNKQKLIWFQALIKDSFLGNTLSCSLHRSSFILNHSKKDSLNTLQDFSKSSQYPIILFIVIITLCGMASLIIQKDLGNTVVMGVLLFWALIHIQIPLRVLISLSTLFVTTVIVFIITSPYRVQRILTF